MEKMMIAPNETKFQKFEINSSAAQGEFENTYWAPPFEGQNSWLFRIGVRLFDEFKFRVCEFV